MRCVYVKVEIKFGLPLICVILNVLPPAQSHDNERLQKELPEKTEYPCPDKSLWRSSSPPSSVHRLRPGDIDVVAALGDSLTAASAARTTNMLEIILGMDNRGLSWSMGGEGDWRKFLTVPNLLKVMNPNLVGYSTGDGSSFTRQSQFNMAYNGAMDQDLLNQAQRLKERLQADQRVDWERHWKMVTIMVGTNDICSDQCHDPEQGPEAHARNLKQVLDYLQDNLPRTLVHLVSMPYIPAYADLVRPPSLLCFPARLMICSCLFGGLHEATKLARVGNLTRQFQAVQRGLVESGRYDTRDDFTVVFQPTNLDSRFPILSPHERRYLVDPHDYSYIASDCIHYTQKLHSSVANTFWNNMLERPGEKTTQWVIPAYREILCPTPHSPFIVTYINSKT